MTVVHLDLATLEGPTEMIATFVKIRESPALRFLLAPHSLWTQDILLPMYPPWPCVAV